MRRTRPLRLAALLALPLLCLATPSAQGAGIVAVEGIPIPQGGELLRDLSGDPQDADDTSVRILDLSGEGGAATLKYDPEAGLGDGESVAEGFVLLDGTLEVVTSLPQGELRARYRIEFDPRAVRAARIRADSLRVMRFDALRARWLPAVQKIRKPAEVRFFPRARPDFVLGHHGFDAERSAAWAVVDVSSRYAVGGLALPEPGALALMGAGATLLWATRRRS